MKKYLILTLIAFFMVCGSLYAQTPMFAVDAITDLVEDTTPQLGGILDSNSHQIRWSKGADVASATALTLGTDGNYFDITGTTAITSIGTLAPGTVICLHFDGILTFTHDGTDLILPGSANITTAANDEAILIEYATGDWRCINYNRASYDGLLGDLSFDTNLKDLTTAEIGELENIGAVTITAGQWGYLGACTAYGGSILDDADEATFKATVNLEAGTDFYSKTAEDTWRASTTVTEMGYVHGLTSDAQTQFGLKLNVADPTFTGVLTVGSAALTEAELENIDGNTSTTTQLNYLNAATGTTGTTSTNLAFSTNPVFIAPTLGAATATSITLDASATPGWVFRDSGNPGTDKEIAKISANFLSGADGAEDGALYLWAMLGGSEILWLAWDSDTEAITMGDSGTGEDLIWDFETATDNEVAVSTNSGTTQINFGTLNLLTTGTIQGAITINSDANGMSQAEMTAVGMYGSAFFATGAGTWNLPAAAAGMSFILYSTGANAIIINPDDADTITYDGVMDTAGHQIASPSAAGDYIAMIALDAVNWYVLGHSGTWVPGA